VLLSESEQTSPEPVADGFAALPALLACLAEWLSVQRDESTARDVLTALTSETLKVVSLSDQSQREFDATDLAQACGWSDSDDLETVTRRIKRAELAVYLSARQEDLEAFFKARGLDRVLRLSKRSPRGRRRAHWYLEPSAMTEPEGAGESMEADSVPDEVGVGHARVAITYDYVPAGQVKPSAIARLLFGEGRFRTKSLRGLLFASTALFPIFVIACMVGVVWLMLFVNRPVTTADLALLLFNGGLSWALWIWFGRGLWWLLDDRLIPAPEVLLKWGEEPAQLENFKEGDVRILGLVRYSGTCPICAAKVELRYGDGNERRRLLGRCIEAPQDHVFTFDRVMRKGFER
jgi:hypothetical protein